MKSFAFEPLSRATSQTTSKRNAAWFTVLLVSLVLPLSGDELDDLVTFLKPPARFANYTPSFTWEEKTVTMQGPKGPYEEQMQIIYDHGKAVAVRSGRPRLDLITHDPAQAPEELTFPVRYHNETYFNATLTTIAWFGKWGPTGDTHEWEFSEGGETITLTEKQVWKGGKGWNGESVHRFTLKVDPVFGYVIEGDLRYEGERPIHRGKGIQHFELTNFLVRDVSTPWLGRWRFDHTVCSRAELPERRYAGWANNNPAGDLSDNGSLPIRDGGLVAYVSENEWSPALMRTGNLSYYQKTCNVWQDQHNNCFFPEKPDPDGNYRYHTTIRLAFLPPELSQYVAEHTEVDTFKDQRQVIIRVGQQENFETQPLPLTTTFRGLTGTNGHLSTERAYSGDRSLKVPPLKNPESRGAFLNKPQVGLKPHTVYEIDAKVWVEEGTQASITADFYEWSPHNPERNLALESNTVKTPGKWQSLHLTIPAQNWDPFTDLRFRVIGEGSAWFDDVHIRAVSTSKGD